MELHARWGMLALGMQDEAPPNPQPGGRKKDPNLSPLSERVWGLIPGPSNYNSVGWVGGCRLISGFVFGSGFRHDFNNSMAHDGRLPVVESFREPDASEAAKAKAKVKAKGKAKAKAAA